MTREEVCARIVEVGVIPAIRVSSAAEALLAAEAVSAGGIPLVEVTMTVPGALDVIVSLAKSATGLAVGAGTVLDIETARRCLDAGAVFLTSTGFDLEVVEFAVGRKIAVLAGALTPSEVMAASKAGSDFVKVFPCKPMGGPEYIRTLKTPFPRILLVASGGVNSVNVAEFIVAGATAVGIGAHLVPRKAIELNQPHRITELAQRFVGLVREARASGRSVI